MWLAFLELLGIMGMLAIGGWLLFYALEKVIERDDD